MNGQVLAATVGDRTGALLRKLELLFPEVARRFDGIAIQALTTTHSSVRAFLETWTVEMAFAEPSVDLIGRHRRQAVGMAHSIAEAARVVYMDLDHLLRWIENDAAELDRLLASSAAFDCTIIGRGPESFAALPARLAATEGIVNHVYWLMTGRKWDLMMAARSLSSRAARLIVNGCAVDSIGNDVAWPLLCESEGLSLGYLEAEGLTYRTNVDYAEDRADSLDDDPEAWVTRVMLAAQQVDAMLPYLRT